MGFHPHSADIDQPLALQPLIGHPGLCRQRPRQVPVALAAERRQDRMAFARSQGQQVARRIGDRPRFYTNEPTRCQSDVARMQAEGRNPGIPAPKRTLPPDSATLDPGYIGQFGEQWKGFLRRLTVRGSIRPGRFPICCRGNRGPCPVSQTFTRHAAHAAG